MSYLILVRHSQSEMQPECPAAQWPLSADGRQRCRILAERLQPYGLSCIYTSQETKAVQTARITARQLGIPWRRRKGMEEHHRSSVRILASSEFQALVARLLHNPDELVFGEETGAQAVRRFSSALQSLLQAHPNENLGVVTHGTVLSLWAAQHFNLPVFEFWQQLGLPAYLVIRRNNGWTLETTQNIP
jgi:broad specificity phosphatase PhoE